MRVIGGEAKGKTIKTLRGQEVRPTSDLVREALFAIIGSRIEGAVFLDLFAGSGSVGIEALSRGAKETIFIDENPKCIKMIRENLAGCALKEKGRIYQSESLRFGGSSRLKPRSLDIIFIDPPYGVDLAQKALMLIDKKEVLTEGSWVIVEHFHKTRFLKELINLKLFKERRFGTTQLSFYLYHHHDRGEEVKGEE